MYNFNKRCSDKQFAVHTLSARQIEFSITRVTKLALIAFAANARQIASTIDNLSRACSYGSVMAFTLTVTLAPAVANAADLFSNTNIGGVNNRPNGPTQFTLSGPAEITELMTYHWNNGQGKAPGTITLESVSAPVAYYQQFPARGEPGSYNVQNANWVATVNVTLPKGTYAVYDSDIATWAQNPQSKGEGFLLVSGIYLPATDLFNNTNTAAVYNAPRGVTVFTLTSPAEITELLTYHWNNGLGKAPGTIGIESISAPLRYNQQFTAHSQPGSYNLQNANWVATLDVTLPAGTYAVYDSDPASWAQNLQSNGNGFAIVRGTHLSAGLAVPPPPPPPPPPPAALPLPCNRTTGASIELAKPGCAGPAGTLLDFVVLNPLRTSDSMVGIQFKPPTSPTACLLQAATPPLYAQVTVFAGPPGSNGLVLRNGSGTSVGSSFTTAAPPALCIAGRGTWTWQIWKLSPTPFGPARNGTIDCFTIQCP